VPSDDLIPKSDEFDFPRTNELALFHDKALPPIPPSADKAVLRGSYSHDHRLPKSESGAINYGNWLREMVWGPNRYTESSKIFAVNESVRNEILNYNQLLVLNDKLNAPMVKETARLLRGERIAYIESAIPRIVDSLIASNPDFKLIDKDNLNKTLKTLTHRLSFDVLTTIKEEDIKLRTKKIMVVESMVSAFKDLTAEEAKLLDETIRE
jgi:hypothetical protein